ncbi:insulin-like growth factor binding protein [Roridomyces roridus]|uniref:Insulin-like growth factor binding protein n=1 Tax=Roridomyces roridus TaxID=1738132 RepID=A0AAD7B6U6_9AGAR|nr:insulin-like growth factor binding protein [Roridomyces roridus]
MFSSILGLAVLFALGAPAAALNSSSIVCVAGQCLQGSSNTTLGVSLSASDVANSVLLLPGQYTATTNPQLVHDLLTSSHATLSSSPGFSNSSTLTLPLSVQVNPGLAIYSQSLYSGQASFSSLPSGPVANSSTPLKAESMALSSSVWAAMSFGSNGRVVFWDSVPDTAQLPLGSTGSMSLLDMQSSTCSPPCASSGTCSASGLCICAPGFNGTSCETCSPGFFGPKCQACPAGCTDCDDGISGSGRCLTPLVANPLTTCNCLNGECAPDGTCTCNPGYVTASNGTACAKCASGFFSTSTGDCKVCQIGCSSCADGTGNCITCASGFTQDQNDSTKCQPVAASAGGVACPSSGFSDGTSCIACSASCVTCSGPTSNDCTSCSIGTGHYLTNNGSCVTASNTGVCEGSNLIADNTKGECDTCGAKCTTCEISNFNSVSTVNQLKCTGCLKGFFLSGGQCIDSCPKGTFLSADNVTCAACDSSCGTCSGSATNCLTCSASNQLASAGKCVSTCPLNTFSSNGTCLACHPDCATCTGSSFSQCASCPPDRPVLSNGRCLPTCAQSQFFDPTSSSCQACDASCSSCAGQGPSNCLACSSASQVLRGGTCTAATCTNSTSVVPGLGVCLSDLVLVSAPPTNNSTITEPTKPEPSPPPPATVSSGGRALSWWEILLMTLGCAFIFLLFLMCWRRRARKQRAKQTAAFAAAKQLGPKVSWFVRFRRKLFGGHRASRRRQAADVAPPITHEDVESEAIKLMKMRNAEEARHHREMEKLELFGAYEYEHSRRLSRASSNHAPSTLPPLNGPQNNLADQVSRSSIYSQVTGMPRAAPEPRQPVNKALNRYPSSVSSAGRSYMFRAPAPEARLVDVDVPVVVPAATEAQVYAQAVRPGLGNGGTYWLEPHRTGTSSNNPFRR